MQALPTLNGPIQELIIDFIIDLPPSAYEGKAYNSILVIVDRYTKIVRYIPYNKTYTSVQLTDLFIKEIVCKYSMLKGIVLDRGSIFTSTY
jgi:uncharacterized membrane protein